MLRVALVGIGDAGRHHARALASVAREGDVAWTAVVARDRERLTAFEREQARGLAIFTDVDAMLDASVCDAVILATPDALHADQVVRAAARGLHVLVEKPLALSRDEGARAVDAARRANVHLDVGYHLRHHPAHVAAHARLGELVGTLRTIFVRWAWPDPATGGWRARGEGRGRWSLSALGTHGVDLALTFAGTEVEDIALVKSPATGVDHAAELSCRIAAGAGDVLVHVSVAITHRAASRVIVTGDVGELEATGTLGARGDGALVHRAPRGSDVAIAFTPADPYAAQLRAFVRDAARGFIDDPRLLTNLAVLDHEGAEKRP